MSKRKDKSSMDASQARRLFLESAPRILDLQRQWACKHQEVPKAQEQRFDTLSKMMLAESDRQKIDADNTKQVIAMLGKGKISVDEAIKLMSLLEKRSEIELAPELLKQIKKLNKKR